MKRWNRFSLRAVAMVLSLVLMLTMVPYVRATETEEETGTTFHAPTILRMIEANLETGNTDEEFYHLLANAYLADTTLFVDIIADLEYEDISYLAKAISYDLYATDRSDLAYIPSDCADQTETSIAKLIYAEVGNRENATLSVFDDWSYTSLEPSITQPLAVGEVLMINAPVINISETEVFDTVQASITISNNTLSDTNRTYSIALYRSDGTTETMICSTRITIPAGSIGATKTVSFTFNATGVYTVSAKYAPLIEGLETSSSPSSSVTVRGEWHIDVELYTNRSILGTLKLYDASGTAIVTVICLGKAEGNKSMYVHNGNTPTGEYTGVLAGPYSPTSSYGPYKVVKLTGVSGAIIDSGRDNIWIHGGDPETDNTPHVPLNVTHGCVRVENTAQLAIAEAITSLIADYHYTRGTVSITETEYVEE